MKNPFRRLEIKNGEVVKETDLEEALVWRSLWENEVNSIFEKYDYLAFQLHRCIPSIKTFLIPQTSM